MSSPEGPEEAPTRRRQIDRTRETRRRLIDATIESLIAEGWSGTSTRSVAQRAGVSQGALQHHFPSKRHMVEASLETVVAELIQRAREWEVPDDEDERPAFLLDRLWEIHRLPINLAVQELLTVGRTDPEIGEFMGRLQTLVENTAARVGGMLMPRVARHPDFPGWITTTMATMRGLVVVVVLSGIEPADMWPEARTVLMRGMPAPR